MFILGQTLVSVSYVKVWLLPARSRLFSSLTKETEKQRPLREGYCGCDLALRVSFLVRSLCRWIESLGMIIPRIDRAPGSVTYSNKKYMKNFRRTEDSVFCQTQEPCVRGNSFGGGVTVSFPGLVAFIEFHVRGLGPNSIFSTKGDVTIDLAPRATGDEVEGDAG